MNAGTGLVLIPLLPLVAFAILAAGASRYGRAAAVLTNAALAGSLVLSVAGLSMVAQRYSVTAAFPWLFAGGRLFEWALWLDPLSAVMSLFVSLIGLVVGLYSVGYLEGEESARLGRFFAEFALFAASMLALVLAGDLLTLFIAWELVGLVSFLMIGYWFERPDVPEAAGKALLITRTGDLLMLIGVLLLVRQTGSGSITAALAAAESGSMGHGLLVTIALLLFAGAAGKSAQVPFQGWLPDAMRGPAPVSAMLHAATMVAAGVYLIARLYPLFVVAAPVLAIVAWIGVITALLGALAALVETDLKRLLAYSTISQMGLMFIGLGAGSIVAGVLLLMAHGLYKATLFLAAGAVEHAVHGTDLERMGGLARRMPLTASTFAIAAAALAGLPVTLALPPKDPAIAAAWMNSGWLAAAALGASLLTAIYTARAFVLVFLGNAHEPAHDAREAEQGLLAPLLALAALIPFGLLVDSRLLGEPLARWLGTNTPEVGAATALALGAAIAGVALGLDAWRLWREASIFPPLGGIAPLFVSEFGLKQVYHVIPAGVARMANALGSADHMVFDRVNERAAQGILGLATRADRFDQVVFDKIATTAAAGTVRLVQAGGCFDMRRLDAAIQNGADALARASQSLRGLTTGHIDNYLLGIFLWGLSLFALAVVALAR